MNERSFKIDLKVYILYHNSMRLRDENKYKAIIEASIRCFRENGFEKTSIAKIAKTAQVSPGTIYIYFKNKEDLIIKLYLQLKEEMSQIVLEDVNTCDGYEVAYKRMWMNYYHYCVDNSAAFGYMMQFSSAPIGKKKDIDYDMTYLEEVHRFFENGKQARIIKNVSDEILFAYTFFPASQLAKRHSCQGSILCSNGVVNACNLAWDAVSESGKGITCIKMNDSKNRLVNIFKSGETKGKKIGAEFEHFLIDTTTLRSYKYFEEHGQLEIARGLLTLGWTIDYEENDHILAMSKNGNSISFEPGGQFEISTFPCDSIVCIDKAYNDVLDDVNQLLQPNQKLVSLGYHPKSKIEDLPLLPKERYKLMYEYLHTKGSKARNMMKGTASTQISIDYDSEADFIKKYRVANFLSPFIALLFDASPVFEGKKYDGENLRIDIWDHTDIERCKYPEHVMKENFSYSDYAQYIMNSKPILLPKGDETIFSGEKTVKMLDPLTKEMAEHVISMVFPDVRVKTYIELRVADALPYPYNMAVPALIKGVFYNENLLDKYYDISKGYSVEDLLDIYARLKESHEFDVLCKHEPYSCKTFVTMLMEDAILSLGDEAVYLERFKTWFVENDTMANHLKTLTETELKAFIGGKHV